MARRAKADRTVQGDEKYDDREATPFHTAINSPQLPDVILILAAIAGVILNEP